MDINQYQARTGRILKENGTVINEADILERNAQVVKESYSGTTGGELSCIGYNGYSILLSNDDAAASITLTVNTIPIVIKAGEVMDEQFDTFTQYSITDGVAHRRIVRGV